MRQEAASQTAAGWARRTAARVEPTPAPARVR